MIPVLSQDNMKRSDARECSEGAGGRELMRRAGEGIFAAANWKAPVAILCGGGNNAGDGYVLALCMKRAGIPCSLLRLGDRFSADGQHYYGQCLQAGIPDALYTEQTDLRVFGSIAVGVSDIGYPDGRLVCIGGRGRREHGGNRAERENFYKCFFHTIPPYFY